MDNSFRRKIYLYKFFDDFVLIYPLYAVMFVDHGLSTLQISTLFIVWSATTFLFEVPSGVWADQYSRKNLLVIAQLIRMVGYAVWTLFPTFTGFLTGFVLWGIKSALTSGTYQALIYDELKQSHQESRYVEIVGKAKSLSHLAILLGSLGASAAIVFGYPFVLILSMTAVGLSALLVFLLPKVKATRSTREREYFAILKKGLRLALKSPQVLRVILFVGVVVGLSLDLEEYWPLFLNDVGLPRYAFGVIFSVFGLAQIVGSLVAHRFEKWPDSIHYLLIVVSGLLLLVAAHLMELISVPLVILFIFLFEIVGVVFDGRLQAMIPSATRATVTSVKGFVSNISGVVAYGVFGLIANRYTNQDSFIFFGGLIIVLTTLLIFSARIGFRKPAVPRWA